MNAREFVKLKSSLKNISYPFIQAENTMFFATGLEPTTSFKTTLSRLLQARSSLTFRQL